MRSVVSRGSKHGYAASYAIGLKRQFRTLQEADRLADRLDEYMKDTWKQEFDIQLLKNQLEKRKKYPRGVPAGPSPEELREPRQRDEEKARKEAKHALKCKLAWKIVPLMVCQRAVRAMEAGKRKPRGAPPRAARRAPGTWSDSEPTGTGPRTGAQGPLATTATPHRVSTTRAAGQLHRTRLGGGPSGSQGGPQTAAPRYSAGVPTEARSVRAAGAPPSAGTQTVASSPDHPRHSRQSRSGRRRRPGPPGGPSFGGLLRVQEQPAAATLCARHGVRVRFGWATPGDSPESGSESSESAP